MKKFAFILFSLGSISTFACTKVICPGDRVIPAGYTVGHAIVKAVNPNSDLITVAGSLNNYISRKHVKDIGLMKGCVQGICVGDKVIPDRFVSGHAIVKAVNPVKGILTVQGSLMTTYSRVSAKKVSVIDECLEYGENERHGRND